MTTFISRLFSGADSASEAAGALEKYAEFRPKMIEVVTSDTSALDSALDSAGIEGDTADTVRQRLSDGNALLVAKAPFGAVAAARSVLDQFESIDAGLPPSGVYRRASAGSFGASRPAPAGNRLILSGERWSPLAPAGAFLSSLFGLRLLSPRQSPHSVTASGPVLAGPTILHQKRRDSTMRPGPVLGMKTLTERRIKSSVLRDNPTPLSSALSLPTVIRR